MYKGPPAPPNEEKSESAKDRILHTLENEPSLYTGIVKALVVLGVGYGYFGDNLGSVIISVLTALIVLLLSVIDRGASYGPRTVQKLIERARRP